MNNFRRIFSFIVGSIVGTGVLILPTMIIGTGSNVFISLIISSILFGGLGYLFSLTHTPFEDIKEIVPSKMFYKLTSIYYWILSWSSTILIIYEMTQGIIGITGIENISSNIWKIQCIIVIIFILIQKIGIDFISKLEIVMTFLKIVLLIGIPTVFVVYAYYNGFNISYDISMKSVMSLIPSIMWMYLGIESCSLISNNKQSYFPVLFSVFFIFLLYLFNSFSILSVMTPLTDLTLPYQSTLLSIFSSPLVSTFMSIVMVLLCIGSTNSWFVMSTRTLQSLPDIFPSSITSSYFRSSLVSSLGLLPLAFLISSPDAKSVFLSLLDYFAIFSSLFYLVASYSICIIYKSFWVGIPICIAFAIFFIYTFIYVKNALICFVIFIIIPLIISKIVKVFRSSNV